MDKAESIFAGIMLILCLISGFKAGKCFEKGETLKAIYYEIIWVGLMIMFLLGK